MDLEKDCLEAFNLNSLFNHNHATCLTNYYLLRDLHIIYNYWHSYKSSLQLESVRGRQQLPAIYYYSSTGTKTNTKTLIFS